MTGAGLEKISLVSHGPWFNLHAEAVWLGEDLLVYIWGGEHPHIGAVAMAEPRPSLEDPGRISATASVFTYLGHKEDHLSRRAALKLASMLDCKVVVTAGAHWEGLSLDDIGQVLKNADQLIEDLGQQLMDQPYKEEE